MVAWEPAILRGIHYLMTYTTGQHAEDLEEDISWLSGRSGDTWLNTDRLAHGCLEACHSSIVRSSSGERSRRTARWRNQQRTKPIRRS